MKDLELIIKYKMDDTEAKAFKVALMWQDLCKKEFPNERHLNLSKSKDPRQTTLFKYCYKLIKETKGLLASDKEYYIYIVAQLQMLKLMKQGEIHALIEPQILVGDKAWTRWKMWKKRFDKKLSEMKTAEDLGLVTSPSQIKIELKNTKKFLLKYEFCKITKEQMNRWHKNNMISPYYVALSNFAKSMIDDFDHALYQPSITPEVEDFFKKEFEKEIYLT